MNRRSFFLGAAAAALSPSVLTRKSREPRAHSLAFRTGGVVPGDRCLTSEYGPETLFPLRGSIPVHLCPGEFLYPYPTAPRP